MKRRLRGTCKWGGVTLCALLFALWLASGWWGFIAERQETMDQLNYGPLLRFTIGQGRAGIFLRPMAATLYERKWFFDCSLLSYFEGWNWLPVLQRTPRPNTTTTLVFVPLWFPFLLIALPTGFLFWSDRHKRTRVGHCAKCGYDLTGNTSGKCPECGATTPARVAT